MRYRHALGRSGSRGEGGRGGGCARERMLGAKERCRLGLNDQSQQTTGAGGRGLGCSTDKPPASAGLRVGCGRRKRDDTRTSPSCPRNGVKMRGFWGARGSSCPEKGHFFMFSRWKGGMDRAEALPCASCAIWISSQALGQHIAAATWARGQSTRELHACLARARSRYGQARDTVAWLGARVTRAAGEPCGMASPLAHTAVSGARRRATAAPASPLPNHGSRAPLGSLRRGCCPETPPGPLKTPRR